MSCFLLKLMCTVDDLKEMGIPLGPRKKIANFVKHKAVKLVRFISAPKRKHSLSLTSLFIFWKFFIHTIMVRPVTVLPAQGNSNRVDGSPDVGVSQNWV